MVTLKTLSDLTTAERTPVVLKHQKGAFLTLGGVGHGLVGGAAVVGSSNSLCTSEPERQPSALRRRTIYAAHRCQRHHRMTRPVPVRLPLDLLAWLDQQAQASAEPRSTVIRQLLREQMERQQRAERRRHVSASR